MGIGPARHHEQILSPFNRVADLVERDAVEKAVGDAVGILVPDERAQRRGVSDQVPDDHASMRGLSPGDTERYVGCGNMIGGGDYYREITAEQ
jgi:hypothetical protein